MVAPTAESAGPVENGVGRVDSGVSWVLGWVYCTIAVGEGGG